LGTQQDRSRVGQEAAGRCRSWPARAAATILVSARITAGPTSVFYSHYSPTSAFESNFGLPLLGAAPTVTPAPIT